MKPKSGIKLLEETKGSGIEAVKGMDIIFNLRLFLNHGDEIPLNQYQIEHGTPQKYVRHVDGFDFIDHRVTLGRRHVIAGIEHALIGMCMEGYRKIRVSPHLAYRDQGMPNLVPPNAILVIDLWLREILVLPTH